MEALRAALSRARERTPQGADGIKQATHAARVGWASAEPGRLVELGEFGDGGSEFRGGQRGRELKRCLPGRLHVAATLKEPQHLPVVQGGQARCEARRRSQAQRPGGFEIFAEGAAAEEQGKRQQETQDRGKPVGGCARTSLP